MPAEPTVAPADPTSSSPGVDPPSPSRDAGAEAEAMAMGTPSPCQRTNLFCDDFDDGDGSIGTKWSAVTTSAGPFDLDETLLVSPPRALRLRTTTGAGVRGSALKQFLNIASDVKISLDVRVDIPSTGSFEAIAPLIVGVSPASQGLAFQSFTLLLHPEGGAFEAYRSFTDGGSASSSERMSFSYGVYHRITVTLRSAGGTTTAVAAVDGVIASTRTLQTETPRSLGVEVGASYTRDVNLAATIRVDNVIVERL